jgi:hypothetical protein
MVTPFDRAGESTPACRGVQPATDSEEATARSLAARTATATSEAQRRRSRPASAIESRREDDNQQATRKGAAAILFANTRTMGVAFRGLGRRGEDGEREVEAGGSQRERAARLVYWNRLFHGIPVDPQDLRRQGLCADASSKGEREAYILLLACTSLSGSARHAVRCALRIAILYWFSNIGERRSDARAPLLPKRSAFHLGEAVGTGLTWDEAVEVMKRKPIDYAAYFWILELLEDECARQWNEHFPDMPAASRWFSTGRGGEGHVGTL